MLRQNLDDFDTNGQKGDWCFTHNDEYLFLQFGNTHDDICMIHIALVEDRSHWAWDGNREAPTISPSIRVMGWQAPDSPPDKWHGFLRAGKLIDA